MHRKLDRKGMVRQMAEEKTAQDSEKEAIEKEYQAKVDAANAGRTGIGTRAAFGFTRGKGSMPFVYERFDRALPDTLPKTTQQFIDATKIADEASMVNLLIDGYNEKLYTDASDPIAEHVNPAWSEEVRNRFRLVVRNYMTGANASLDDAVALLKPGFEKAVAASSTPS